MASSASDLLKLELQATGENDGTWGTKLNTLLGRLEESVAAVTNIAVTASDYTLDDTQYAEHNDGADVDDLKINRISVDEGATMKRWRARARGRAAKILKRTSHLTVSVEEVGR